MRFIQTLFQKRAALILVAFVALAGSLALALPAQYAAAGTDPAATSTVPCGSGSASCPIIDKYVNPGIALLAGLTGVLAVISIVVGGIQVTSSGGDPQKVANGRKHIRNAVVGIAAFIFLYAFLNWILPGGIG
jgi:hypothetical protein